MKPTDLYLHFRNPEGVEQSKAISENDSTLQGWKSFLDIAIHGFHPWLFTFDPFGVWENRVQTGDMGNTLNRGHG